MPVPTKELTLLESKDTDTVPDLATQIMSMAANPQLDVEKLKALIGMKREADQDKARSEFHAALQAAQSEMGTIAADAFNKQTQSKYATYAKLDRVLRPIYNKHGFGLSFDTADCPRDHYVRVVCSVSHAGGFTKDYHIDMPADGKGAKGGDVMTLTHAIGAGTAYGMRYLLKMIFNVRVGDEDTDGNAPEDDVDDPKGFQDWIDDMNAAADEGLPVLQAAWAKSSKTFKEHTAKHYQKEWEALKAKAAKVGQ